MNTIDMQSLIVHINMARTWRGGERQVALLYRELHRDEIHQKIFCRKGSALHEYCIDNGFDCIAFSTLSSLLLAPFYLVFYRVRKPLIIHCHESKGQTIAVLAKILSIKRIKVVAHRRVLFPIKKKFTSSLKYSEKHVHKMICISKAVEKGVWDSIGFTSTVVVPSCISINKKQGVYVDVRKEFGISHAAKVITYIAALTFEKDHSTFFKTAVQILKKRQNVHFLVVGDGPLKGELEQEVRFLNIENHVTFTGFLKEPERIIPDVDLLLFTSKSEGLGSTILDFFVYQKPVVSVRNGGAEEIISAGRTGFLSSIGDFEDLADKVVEILNDPALAKKITDAAYEYVVENHTPESVAERTLNIYRDVERNY